MDRTPTGGRRLRRLLLATDRSAASLAALLAVAGLAVGGGTEVVVLHVDDLGQPEEGRRLAADIVSGLIALAVNARPELRQMRRGQVAAVIAAAAAEHGSDLVVLGSRGRSDLGGLLLGSVSFEVLERVWCPVLLVRTTAAVAELEARVLVLHLLAPDDDDLQTAISENLVQQMVTGLRRCGVRARDRVRAGRSGTAEEIARKALGFGADLIVMGSRRLPALAALLRGSVSHRVVHLSDRPVLIVAPKESAPEE